MHCAFQWNALKTCYSREISHFGLVFHIEYRGNVKLGISYFLVIFSGACMCMQCMYVYVVHVSWYMFLVVHVCVCGAWILRYVFGSGCDTCIYYCACIHTSFEWYIHVHVVYVSVDYVYIDNIYKYKKIRSNGLEMSHFGTQW